MLPILLRIMMKDIIEKAEARGEPYTVWACIKDLLIVYLLMFIEFFIFMGAYIILHTSNIQQNGAWVKPVVYGATFIVMCIVGMGYMTLMVRVEQIIRNRKKNKCSLN